MLSTNTKQSVKTTNQTSPTATASPAMQEKTATEAAVTLTSTGFNPQVLTIKIGTKVVWTNKSGQLATVNSDPHPTHTAYPRLNLGEFDNGQSLSLIFDKVGRYGYHNHIDASEIGTVIVTQ